MAATEQKYFATQTLSHQMPYRNMACNGYMACLTRAAHTNKVDLGCSTCSGSHGAICSGSSEHPKPENTEFVSSIDAAAILGIKLYRLVEMRKNGSGPAFIRDGKAILYKRSDLRSFVESRKCDRTEVATPEASRILGITEKTLITMRKNKVGPRYRKTKGACMYSLKGLEEYKHHMNKGDAKDACTHDRA